MNRAGFGFGVVLLPLVGLLGAPATLAQSDPGGLCITEGPPSAEEQRGTTAVSVETTVGAITVWLCDEQAPVTVANFRLYVEEGFYDGTIFHRAVQDFMIQGGGYDEFGDPLTAGHAPIQNEAASSGLLNRDYTLAMARTQDPDSATSQFFINVADNDFLDAGDGLDGYAVFGYVDADDGSQDVVDLIESQPAHQGTVNDPCYDTTPSCPDDPVVILEAKVLADPDSPTTAPVQSAAKARSGLSKFISTVVDDALLPVVIGLVVVLGTLGLLFERRQLARRRSRATGAPSSVPAWQPPPPQDSWAAAEPSIDEERMRLLDERFRRGEIDEATYRRLRDQSGPR